MDSGCVRNAVRDMLREQLCCVGRVAARHHIPEDAVWEIVKGFDVIYQRARRQAEGPPEKPETEASTDRPEPHPGILYLLEKLDQEGAGLAEE